MTYCNHFTVLLLLTAWLAESGAAESRLALLPERVLLSSSEARQTLIVQWQIGDEFEQQAAKGVEFKSSDESIVRIEDGQAISVANGKAKITASIDGQTATADVTVSGMDK